MPEQLLLEISLGESDSIESITLNIDFRIETTQAVAVGGTSYPEFVALAVLLLAGRIHTRTSLLQDDVSIVLMSDLNELGLGLGHVVRFILTADAVAVLALLAVFVANAVELHAAGVFAMTRVVVDERFLLDGLYSQRNVRLGIESVFVLSERKVGILSFLLEVSEVENLGLQRSGVFLVALIFVSFEGFSQAPQVQDFVKHHRSEGLSFNRLVLCEQTRRSLLLQFACICFEGEGGPFAGIHLNSN